MTKPAMICDLDCAIKLIDAESVDSVDGSDLEMAIDPDGSPQGKAFWMNELKNFDYATYLSTYDDEEEDEDFEPTGKLSEIALDAIRAAVAQKLGITAAHVAAGADKGMQRIGMLTDKVIEDVTAKLDKPAPTPAVDAFPDRAMKFGEAQVMRSGAGHFDNARYFNHEED